MKTSFFDKETQIILDKAMGVIANLSFIGFIIAWGFTKDTNLLIIAVLMKLIAIDTKT